MRRLTARQILLGIIITVVLLCVLGTMVGCSNPYPPARKVVGKVTQYEIKKRYVFIDGKQIEIVTDQGGYEYLKQYIYGYVIYTPFPTGQAHAENRYR